MGNKKQQKSLKKIEASDEFRDLVNQSIAEMDNMTEVAVNAGVDPDTAREKVAALYMRNLQQTDDMAALVKKNIAELMTRIQLDRSINKEQDLVSKRYVHLFKLQNEALKLLKSMEPKQVNHKVQIDDDKMFFDVPDGVYEEK